MIAIFTLECSVMKICNYCGKVNPADARACGEGQWDGCGAALPERVHVAGTTIAPIDTGRYRPSLYNSKPARDIWPHPVPLPRYRSRPGKTMRQFQRDVEVMKTQIGLALLPALQEALRQWGGRP